ncbi:MAG: polysaccharide deacetylase family protein [Clostridiales bacterium]|nr:polysaccharide deacetylase family protein [Candidatus Blautia equi]
MPGRKAKTNRLLLLLTLVLALLSGGLFTQSSALPSAITERTEPDMIVADDINVNLPLATGEKQLETDSTPAAEEEITETEEPVSEPDPEPTATPTPEPTATFTPTPSPEPTAVPIIPEIVSVYETSPEAEQGVWKASGTHWVFMVDGNMYTGWLTDIDGKRYYLGADGFMQTGWIEDGGNRYYLDQDGIMQIGEVNIDGTLYNFGDDGILNRIADGPTITPVPSKEPVVEKVPEPTATAAPTPEPEEPKADADKDQNKKEDVKEPEAPADKAEPADKDTPAEEKPAEEKTEAEKPAEEKCIALTFEDGPSEFTRPILDALAENGARATFFLQGSHLDDDPSVASLIAEAGHELGNHGYTHFNFAELNLTDSSAEVDGVDEVLGLVDLGTSLLRPPYDSMNAELAGITRKAIILWSIDSQDTSLTGAQEIADQVIASAADGGIILMHDSSSLTAEAVKLLVPALQKEGYTFMTVTELAAHQGITLNSGVTYSSFTK